MNEKYIPLDECEDGFLYKLSSRNLGMGVYCSSTQAFIGIRTKYEERFLDNELHWDNGPPHGTAKPLEKLGKAPEGIPLRCILGTVDGETGRPVKWTRTDKPMKGMGVWSFADEPQKGDDKRELFPCSKSNKALFQWIEKQLDARYDTEEGSSQP